MNENDFKEIIKSIPLYEEFQFTHYFDRDAASNKVNGKRFKKMVLDKTIKNVKHKRLSSNRHDIYEKFKN